MKSKYGKINDLPRGWINTDYKRKVYDMWRKMFVRCYSEEFQIEHPTYKGCFVHPDFFYFSKFYDYLTQLDTWEDFINTCNEVSWCIDKDIIEFGNKEYAPGKISLVTKSTNSKESVGRVNGTKQHKEAMIKVSKKNKKPIIGINVSTGLILIFTSRKDAASKGFKSIGGCLKGGKYRHTAHGFKWSYLYMCDRPE